jgi:hypothetical protein
MSSNKVFREYNKIYKDYLGKDLDTNYIINWYKNSTDKNRTPPMFKVFLLNSDIYHNYIYNRVEKVYNNLITLDLTKDYVKQFIGFLKDDIVSDERIFSFIIKSDVYKEYNTNLIVLFYKFLTGKECRAETVDKYMEYYKEKPYSYELLHKQIVDDEKLKEDKIEQIKVQHLELKGFNADLKIILNILSTLKNNESVVKSIIVNNNIFDNEILYKFIELYTTTFNRDIHVLEFIKFYPKLCIGMKALKESELKDEILSIFNIHKTKLQIVKTLYKNYLNELLEEKVFIQKYNKLIETEGYENIIINSLIEKDEYTNLMKEHINNLYKETYSKKISDFDLNYCYNIFKSKKYSLIQSEISQNIIKISDLTKLYLEQLYSLFNSLLQREPDKREYQKYISKYRQDEDLKETNKYIENELLDSLEYQMVLKEKIAVKYNELYNEPAIPSIIFMILKEIIDNNSTLSNCKKDDEELIKLIKKLVEETL